MNIKMPTFADIPALTALWQEAFGDTGAYIDGFMSTAFSEKRAFAAFVDGSIAAALYWFDCSVCGERAAYLYAIATSKEFRGRGICSALMDYTHRYLASAGYAIVLLVPSEEGLFDFYGKMGYLPFGGINEVVCHAANTPSRIEKIDVSQYRDLRRKMLPTKGVLQEKENLAYLNLDFELYRGEDFLLAARREGKRLFAVELLGNPGAADGILTALGCTEGVFRTPGDKRRFAMYLPLKKDAPVPSYFGLAFD